MLDNAMMNRALYIVMAAIFAAVCVGGVSATNTDWDLASSLVKQVKDSTITGLRKSYLAALDADKDAGAAIERFEIKAETEFGLIIEKLQTQIREQTLTQTRAQKAFEKVVDFYTEYLHDIGEAAKKLPEDTKSQIEKYVAFSFERTHELFLDLSKILPENIL